MSSYVLDQTASRVNIRMGRLRCEQGKQRNIYLFDFVETWHCRVSDFAVSLGGKL